MPQVYLNIGSNTAREAHIGAGLDALQQQFGELHLSSVYESEALGFSGAPFFNLAVSLQCELPLGELAQWLRELEYANGREREATRFSSRTLDIDILSYGDTVGCIDGVELPRPEILVNAHVLGPLAELVPHSVHPVAGRQYAQLWAEYGSREKVWLVTFSWRGQRISSAAG